jgi:uncharacterized protein (TIGR02145 family)
MFFKKIFLSIIYIASFSIAQTINVSGTVLDNNNVGIAGATVRLQKSGLSTMTGSGGTFVLSSVVHNIQTAKLSIHSILEFVDIKKNEIKFYLYSKKNITVIAYNVEGRKLYSISGLYLPGTHCIVLQERSNDIQIIEVMCDNVSTVYKMTPLGAVCKNVPVNCISSVSFDRQGKSYSIINDTLSVTKEGYLDYTVQVANARTSNISITMLPNAGNMVDAEGHVYQSVQIGKQIWTVENLYTTKYNDGTPIPYVTGNLPWMNLTTPGYCYYSMKYGILYNWYTISPKNANKIIPAGWHVPTEGEWETLVNYLIGAGYNWDGTKTINKIAKSIAARTGWRDYPVTGAVGNDLNSNNRSGFTGLPGGYRDYDGSFAYQTEQCKWWTISESNASYAWNRSLEYDLSYIFSNTICLKSYGCYIRLVRD